MNFYGPAWNRKEEKAAWDEYYPIIKESLLNFTESIDHMWKNMPWVNSSQLDEMSEMIQNFTANMIEYESS